MTTNGYHSLFRAEREQVPGEDTEDTRIFYKSSLKKMSFRFARAMGKNALVEEQAPEEDHEMSEVQGEPSTSTAGSSKLPKRKAEPDSPRKEGKKRLRKERDADISDEASNMNSEEDSSDGQSRSSEDDDDDEQGTSSEDDSGEQVRSSEEGGGEQRRSSEDEENGEDGESSSDGNENESEPEIERPREVKFTRKSKSKPLANYKRKGKAKEVEKPVERTRKADAKGKGKGKAKSIVDPPSTPFQPDLTSIPETPVPSSAQVSKYLQKNDDSDPEMEMEIDENFDDTNNASLRSPRPSSNSSQFPLDFSSPLPPITQETQMDENAPMSSLENNPTDTQRATSFSDEPSAPMTSGADSSQPVHGVISADKGPAAAAEAALLRTLSKFLHLFNTAPTDLDLVLSTQKLSHLARQRRPVKPATRTPTVDLPVAKVRILFIMHLSRRNMPRTDTYPSAAQVQMIRRNIPRTDTCPSAVEGPTLIISSLRSCAYSSVADDLPLANPRLRSSEYIIQALCEYQS